VTQEPDPIGNDARRERRRRGLPEEAACVICGETDPVALVKAPQSLMERHHLGGEANDPDLTVVLCLTHHRVQTNDQAGAGVDLTRARERTVLESLISVLNGLALFFHALAHSLNTWAEKVGSLVAQLDASDPKWRDLPAAQA
jgi:hypothetical protein